MKKLLASILCLCFLVGCGNDGTMSYSSYYDMMMSLNELSQYDVVQKSQDQVLMDESSGTFCALSKSTLEVTVYVGQQEDVIDGTHYEYYKIKKENSFGYAVGDIYNIDSGTLEKGEASSQLYHFEDGLETIGELTYDVEQSHFTDGIIFSSEDIDTIEKEGNTWTITFKNDSKSNVTITTNKKGIPKKISYKYGLSSSSIVFSNFKS